MTSVQVTPNVGYDESPDHSNINDSVYSIICYESSLTNQRSYVAVARGRSELRAAQSETSAVLVTSCSP